MELQIFDVEHGACALLTCDNNARVMFDCGHNATTGWAPGSHLKKIGVKNLDMLVITNYDEDHVSGLPNLRALVSISHLWRNKTVTPDILKKLKSEDGMGDGIEELVGMATTYTSDGGFPQFPDVEYQAFHLNYPEFDDENNLSFVVHLKLNGIDFLFPGDLEKEGWETLLARNEKFRAAVADTSVLIAPHHGRESGICPELFTKYGCKPYLVVISDKGYAHDTQKTVPFYFSYAKGATFRGKERKVLTTRNDDEISFWFNDKGWGAR